jgi:PAS domain S-box-containing protein
MGERLNLLLIEDNEADGLLLIHELRRSGFDVDVERIQTADELQAALTRRSWDAIVSDYRLPTFSAPHALDLVQQSGLDLPFIVVSGLIGEETAVEMMRAGAHDYLMKDNLNRLAEALRREIREAQVRKKRKQAEIALRESEERFRMLFERSNDAIFIINKKTGEYLDANNAAVRLTGKTLEEIKTLSIFDVIPIGTDKRFSLASTAKDTIDFGEVSYIQPDGGTRTALLSVLPINENFIYGIAHDITDRKLSEEALKRRARELEALYHTSLEINAQTDLMPMLHTIVEQAAKLLNTRMGGLYLMQVDTNVLKLVVAHNLPENFLGVTLHLGEGLSGRIALSGEPMMLEDYSAWEGQAEVYRGAAFRRVLGVPLRVKGRVIGVINVTDEHQTGSYSPEEVQLLKLFADQAAFAVENARLLETVQSELAERIQAEEALRESEERYRTVVTGTPVVSFVLDAQGTFVMLEGKGLARLGLSPGQLVGSSIYQVYKDYPDVGKSVRRAMAGESFRSEMTVLGITFDALYTPVFGEDGRVKGVIGVANDITERKQAEDLLRESEKSYRGLFNSVAEAIFIQDHDGRFLDVNEGAVKMYGHPRQAFIGKTLEFLSAQGKNNLDVVKKAIHRAFAGRPQEFEFWGWRKNGEIFPEDVRVYQGTYFGQDVVITLSVDITERKKAEQSLQRQLKELTILHKVTTNIIHATSTDELVQLVTHEVGETFYPDNFGFLFLDESQSALRPHPSYQGITENVPQTVPLDGCISGAVMLSGKPLRLGDVSQSSTYLMVTSGIRSELCIPIKIGERSIGVINAESRQPDFFTPEDERLLLTIAGQLAIAMEQIRLFEAEKRRRQEAETLRQATAAISTSLELNQVLRAILTSLAQVVPYDSSSVFLLEGDHLRITITQGIPNSDNLINKVFSADDPLFKEVQNTLQPLILQDAQDDPRFHRWGGTAHVHGWMAVPLIARGQVMGLITLDSCQEAAYDGEEASLAQAFANQAAVAIQNARLFEESQRSLDELNRAYESTIEGWSRALDLRDRETEGHTRRVMEITLSMAQALAFSEEELVHIRRGALLHDIGKMGIPDRILLKPGVLTDDEMEIMRRHPQYAYDMLYPIEYLRPALDIPYRHHERWDGSGYPGGLKGEGIPLIARIFAVIDVWDALLSDRPYRVAWERETVLKYLADNAGIQFDPKVVELFLLFLEQEKL